MGKKNRNGRYCHMILLICLLLLCMVICAAVGSAGLSVKESLLIIASRIPLIGKQVDLKSMKEVYVRIVWDIRMPRILLAGFTGCGLSVVGAVFQGIFRNPLADPHILGVSSGAALGATIAMLTGIGVNFLGQGAIVLFSFASALLTVFLVYQISSIGYRSSGVTIILAGTVISTMFFSVISLLMSLNHDQIEKVYLWTLGSFSAATWSKVLILALFVIVGTATMYLFSRELDAMVTGNDVAESLGIHTAKVRKILIIFASVVVAACVSVSGIIGFAGLVIPHSIRLLSGPGHKKLIPLCCVAGAIFMIVCDTIGRSILSPSEIPVGVITAILGTPYFLFLLYRNNRKLGA